MGQQNKINQISNRYSWLVSALFFIILIVSSQSVQAKETVALQGENQTCTAIDLVVVIDQSDSMFITNDKNGRRFDAAKTIVNYLGNHATWLCPEQEIQHRVAVIGFGDRSIYVADDEGEDNPYRQDIAIYLPPTTIPQDVDFASDTELREAWKSYRDGTASNLINSG